MEQEISSIGKVFFASVVAWVINDAKLNWKIKGNPQEVEAFTKAIFAVKRYHDELKSPTATIDSVMQKINEKNKAIADYEEKYQRKLPL